MPKKKPKLDRLADLTWNDLEEWAGSKIVSRGKNYQRQGRVCDLAKVLDSQVKDVAEREAGHVFRFPVDRVITMKRFGTVITGTTVSGRVKTGDGP